MRQKTLQEIELDRRALAALLYHQDVAWRQTRILAAAIGADGYVEHTGIPFVLELARLSRDADPKRWPKLRADAERALDAFELLVRPGLVAYLDAYRAARHLHWAPHPTPAIRALVHHFDYHTKVPVSTSRVHRVLIWCWRTIRAARETFR